MTDISYHNWYSMSDNAIMDSIGAYVKHHRIQKNWPQAKVAKSANISRSTLSLLERGETVTLATLIQVLRSLELLHVMDVFQIQKSISPMALAKMQAKERKRAGYKMDEEKEDLDWQ